MCPAIWQTLWVREPVGLAAASSFCVVCANEHNVYSPDRTAPSNTWLVAPVAIPSPSPALEALQHHPRHVAHHRIGRNVKNIDDAAR